MKSKWTKAHCIVAVVVIVLSIVTVKGKCLNGLDDELA